jgi:hypothetical protein
MTGQDQSLSRRNRRGELLEPLTRFRDSGFVGCGRLLAPFDDGPQWLDDVQQEQPEAQFIGDVSGHASGMTRRFTEVDGGEHGTSVGAQGVLQRECALSQRDRCHWHERAAQDAFSG